MIIRADGKRPDGATLVPWTREKPLALDVTVPDTYAASHIPSTSVSAWAAAEKSAAKKTIKYATITYTHLSFLSLLRQAAPDASSRRNSSRISAGESPSSLASRWRQRISFREYQWHYREAMQSLFVAISPSHNFYLHLCCYTNFINFQANTLCAGGRYKK